MHRSFKDSKKVIDMASFDNDSALINKRVILVRFGGEFGIKSRQTRRRMVGHLRHNIEILLKQYGIFKIIDFRDRLLLFSESYNDLEIPAHDIVNSISGVSSVSPALIVKATESTIISGGLKDATAHIQPNSSFAVRVRREGKHPFSSMDIARKLGSTILSSGIKDIKVDLENPDFKIFLDIRGPLAFIYTKVFRGMDGIPSQSQGTVVALIRPNYNSIFAAWLMKKRGVNLVPIFFKTGKLSEEAFISKTQSHFGHPITTIPIQSLLDSFKTNSSLCLYCQLYCEYVCQNIAKEQRIPTIVSPTCFDFNEETMSLESLEILEKISVLPIIRPIQLGFFGQRLDEDNLDLSACCSFRSKVSLQMSDDFYNIDIKEIFSFKPERRSII